MLGLSSASLARGARLCTLCLATDQEGCQAQEYWYRGAWFDSLGVFWQDFCAPGPLRERTYAQSGKEDVGTLAARVCVASGATECVRFVLAWSFPNFTQYWNPLPKEEQTETLKNTWKNYYAHRFPYARSARFTRCAIGIAWMRILVRSTMRCTAPRSRPTRSMPFPPPCPY